MSGARSNYNQRHNTHRSLSVSIVARVAWPTSIKPSDIIQNRATKGICITSSLISKSINKYQNPLRGDLKLPTTPPCHNKLAHRLLSLFLFSLCALQPDLVRGSAQIVPSLHQAEACFDRTSALQLHLAGEPRPSKPSLVIIICIIIARSTTATRFHLPHPPACPNGYDFPCGQLWLHQPSPCCLPPRHQRPRLTTMVPLPCLCAGPNVQPTCSNVRPRLAQPSKMFVARTGRRAQWTTTTILPVVPQGMPLYCSSRVLDYVADLAKGPSAQVQHQAANPQTSQPNQCPTSRTLTSPSHMRSRTSMTVLPVEPQSTPAPRITTPARTT